MDVALGLDEVASVVVLRSIVLILVVMDVALGPCEVNIFAKIRFVLILVVMDVALGQVFSQTLRNQ